MKKMKGTEYKTAGKVLNCNENKMNKNRDICVMIFRFLFGFSGENVMTPSVIQFESAV